LEPALKIVMITTDRNDCNLEHLRLLLADRLSPAGRTEVIAHLDSCLDCCRRLEQLAAGKSWWNDARESLAEVPHTCTRPDTSQVESKAPALPREPSDSEPDVDADAIVSLTLGALKPANRPDVLGLWGEYEIVDVVGRGGMGVVLKGLDRQLNRYVAVKVLAPQFAGNGAARKRFAREAQAAAAVVHPHVIAIYGVDAAAQLPYLVMPYVAGQSLQERIHVQGPLPTSDILCIAKQTAEGLAAAHAQGLVHRDIKPANILLEHNVDRVLITDFGLARAVDDATVTRSGLIAGTPPYMSPEQARGDAIDHRSDLFSLGSVMYAMCTGEAPFQAATTVALLRRVSDSEPVPIRRLNPDVPLWLVRIVERLMEKNVGDRYQTSAELASLLEHCIAHLQQPDRIRLPRELRKTTISRRTRMLGAASLALAVPLALCLPDIHLSGTNSKDQKVQHTVKRQVVPRTNGVAKTNRPTDWLGEADQALQQLDAEVTRLEHILQIPTRENE
jgi:serine/threonine-protein kinase